MVFMSDKCLIVGHSHIFAYSHLPSLQLRGASGVRLAVDALPISDYTTECHADALGKIAELGVFDDPTDWVIVSVLGGNEYNAIGLIEHTAPFDFILPGRVADIPGGDIHCLPYRVVEDVIRGWVHPWANFLCELRSVFRGSIVHLEAPPPIFCNKFIEDNLDVRNADRLKAWGTCIGRPVLRLKLWQCQANVVRALCTELTVDYLPVSDWALEDGAFLAERFRADATHANATYAEQRAGDLIDFLSSARAISEAV